MWKLIDCGSYPWFVLEKKKYFAKWEKGRQQPEWWQ